MDRRTEQQFKNLKVVISSVTDNLDKTSAMELMDALADWAYTQYEHFLIDDEPSNIDEY